MAYNADILVDQIRKGDSRLNRDFILLGKTHELDQKVVSQVAMSLGARVVNWHTPSSMLETYVSDYASFAANSDEPIVIHAKAENPRHARVVTALCDARDNHAANHIVTIVSATERANFNVADSDRFFQYGFAADDDTVVLED